MRFKITLFLTIVAFVSKSAFADIIFSVVPSSTEMTIGSTAEFAIFIQSRNDTPVTVGGYSINVNAGLGDGKAGVFSAGTFSFLVGDPNQSWDLATTPGQAFSTADTGNAGGSGLGAALSTLRPLGVLTLDTSGAIEGNYTVSLDQLSAIQTNGDFFSGGTNGASFIGPVSYSITAVPEPGTLVLLGAFSIASLGWRYRGYKARKVVKV